MPTETKSKFEQIVNKIIFNKDNNGDIYFFPSIYGLNNMNPAGSYGGALDYIYKNKKHYNQNEFGCDVLAIAGLSKYSEHKNEQGMVQLITFISVKVDDNIDTKTYSVFIDKYGEIKELNHIEAILNNNFENLEFLYPVHCNNGWHCTWKKANAEEMKIIINNMKEFINN